MQVAGINSSTRVLNLWGRSVYIVIHRQTVSLYHNSSVWLDTLDASSRDQNLPNFMLGINSSTRVLNLWEGSVYIVIHRQTVSLYHNSSVWLDTLDASSWDQNPPNFMLE